MPRNASSSQSQTSRENGKRSHGPVSADGRQRSAKRGTKSGLRARTQALGHESADRGERGDHWHDHYGAKSPSALHMTNQCARATLLSDRVDEYQHAELNKQVRDEKEKWHRKQKRRLRYLAGQIRKKPPLDIVKKLMAFGEGVAFLAVSFRAMIHEINERGHLGPEAVECLRLLFRIPLDEEENRRNRLAYWLTLNTLGCTPEASAAELAKWLEPANRPLPLRDQPIAELMGANAAACRAALSKRLQEAVDELRELEIRVRKETDEPALLEVLQRASILKDDAARRVARCQAEVRATFHRGWRDLVVVLESDEEKGLDGFGGDEEDEGTDQDQDQEGVVVDEPEPLSTGGDAVPEPACRGSEEFSPFQPEELSDQSAQLPEAVAVSVESLAARVECAKSATTGAEGGTNGAQNPQSEPGSPRTASAGQMRSAGPRSRASGWARSSTFSASARPSTASDRPRKVLNPRARSAIEALNRDTMADITMRGEPMRSEHPLRE